jgi:DNA-binding beta-propeller fold protein YncE
MTVKVMVSIVGVLAACLAARAEALSCPAPARPAVVELSGHPFSAVPSPDNCWLFASLSKESAKGGIAVLRNRDGVFGVEREVPFDGEALGATLTHDGKWLLVTSNDRTAAFDVAALEQGDEHPLLGEFRNGAGAGAVYAATSMDDKLLFVSDERARGISVFDLARARRDGFRHVDPIGRIPTSIAPVGLAVTPDGRWLFATSQVGPAGPGMPSTCPAEDGSGRMHPQGLLLLVDIAKAADDPAHAVKAARPAGCNPVRVAVAASGKELWVTARGDGKLLRSAIGDWLDDDRHAGFGGYPIGTSPVGVAIRPDGKQVWATLSHRFEKGDEGQVIGLAFGNGEGDIKRLSAPAPGFPRELVFLPDGRTLVVTLFDGKQVKLLPTPDG